MRSLPRNLILEPDARRRLIAVAGGEALPDLVFRGGAVLNVFTGRLEEADVGLAAGRVAWVGRASGGPAGEEVDVRGKYLLPGFIEPHAHLDMMYRPEQALGLLARHGTTCACADTVFLMASLDDDAMLALADKLSTGPARLLWNFRPWVDAVSARELEGMGVERVLGLFERMPDVVAMGEVTSWPALIAGDERLETILDRALREGLRVEGHAPSASPKRLGQLLAAGITACHEALTGKELLWRLSLGYWTELRHSDLRPDGPDLARELANSGLPTDRLMLTTDGPEAESLAAGHLDRVIAEVVNAGLDPIQAIKMATINPATYLGLDAHLGSISPGRCADIVVASTLERPSPEQVWIAGQPPTSEEKHIDWHRLGDTPLAPAPIGVGDLDTFSPGTPGIEMEGVVTRLLDPPSEPLPSGWLRAYLISRDGRWIVGAPVSGLGVIDGFATSVTGFGNVLVLGDDPDAMRDAYRRVVDSGGGIACAHDPTLTLPVLGTMTDRSFDELLAGRSALRKELARRGLRIDSLDFFGLFSSIGVIPAIKFTDRGILDVRKREIVVPARKL